MFLLFLVPYTQNNHRGLYRYIRVPVTPSTGDVSRCSGLGPATPENHTRGGGWPAVRSLRPAELRTGMCDVRTAVAEIAGRVYMLFTCLLFSRCDVMGCLPRPAATRQLLHLLHVTQQRAGQQSRKHRHHSTIPEKRRARVKIPIPGWRAWVFSFPFSIETFVLTSPSARRLLLTVPPHPVSALALSRSLALIGGGDGVNRVARR